MARDDAWRHIHAARCVRAHLIKQRCHPIALGTCVWAASPLGLQLVPHVLHRKPILVFLVTIISFAFSRSYSFIMTILAIRQ